MRIIVLLAVVQGLEVAKGWEPKHEKAAAMYWAQVVSQAVIFTWCFLYIVVTGNFLAQQGIRT